MIGTNGYAKRSSLGLMLACMDGFLIVASLWAAAVIRFWGEEGIVFQGEILWKLVALLAAVQITFYYSGLYNLRNFRGKMKMSFSLLECLGLSFLALAILYYSIPSLLIGRGILTLSFFFIFLSAFLGRVAYARVCRKLSKERILIIGTGDLAKRIAEEIREKGEDAFEIIGFLGDRKKC